VGWDHAKTAVIIGAASRVGRAIAVEIARRGFEVGIIDYGMDDARKTMDIVKGEKGSGELFVCDMGDANQAEAMAAHFFSAWGEVGLLVNNTGVDDCGRCAGDIPVAEWKQVIRTNLWGAIHGCQAFIPGMAAQGGGHIAIGTYGAGIIAEAELAPYAIARAAVTSYAEMLRAKLGYLNIGVSMLSSTLINVKQIDMWLERAGFDLKAKVLSKG
jgi:NAD(P)-dependent dehydrogenase (short-subunit alcohol dehydrogenase family)